jgi:hypothetical protein
VYGKTTGGEKSVIVFKREGPGSHKGHVWVALHEADEIGARYDLYRRGSNGFDVNTIKCALEESGEAQDVTGTGDAEQQEAALGRGGHKFGTAVADYDDVVGGEAFSDDDLMCRIMMADSEGVKFTQCGGRKRAETMRTVCRAMVHGAGPNRRPP